MALLDWSAAGDTALVVAASAGDKHAFAELVRRSQGPLRKLLRHLCGGAAEADDLAQEVFLRAWTRLGDLRDPAALRGWLRRLAVTAFLARRRRMVFAQVELDDSTMPAVVSGSDRVDLERALAVLSAAERLCVALHHAEGMTHTEIAEMTGLPLGTVKSHLTRGTIKLRARMGVS